MNTVETLARLVAMPTVSHRPVDAIAALLATRAEDVGMHITRYETAPGKVNIVASAGPLGTDGLVLSGHMDVVPVEGQAWSSDPFTLTEVDGRLHGRGSCDMKGFLAAVTSTLTPELITSLTRELTLIWTHDEEVGCAGSRALVDALQDEGRPLPSQVLIGEPTDFQVCRMHPGHVTLRIACRGIPAHSSRPSLGHSAIQLAGGVLAALHDLGERWAREAAFVDMLPTPHHVLNVGLIHGGTAVNIIPEHCHLDVGIRPLPGTETADIVESAAAVLAPLAVDALALGGEISWSLLQATPGLLTPEGSPLAEELQAHLGCGHSIAVPFATDGGNLATLGTQPIICGPGSIDQAHRADEYVTIKALHQAEQMVDSLVRRRCTG